MDLPTLPEAYDPFVNQNFVVDRPGAAPHELQLTKVGRKTDNEVQRIFYLVFAGRGDLLAQGIYRLRHHTLDTLDLFLVPVAQTKNGFEYEATFNLLKKRG